MKSTSAAPERILEYGALNSGKTNDWAETAEMYRNTDTPGWFYVLNGEPGHVDRLSDKYPAFRDNVQWVDVTDWHTTQAATDKFLGLVTSDDWIVDEFINKPWDWVQQLWDDSRGKLPTGADLFDMPEVDRDWVKINQVYRNWINPLLNPATNPAHVYATAPQQAVRVPTGKHGEWADDPSVVQAFGRIGVRPEGQKHLGHNFFSVIHKEQPRRGEWTMTTVDDHTREQMVDKPVGLFPLTYLVEVAHWSM